MLRNTINAFSFLVKYQLGYEGSKEDFEVELILWNIVCLEWVPYIHSLARILLYGRVNGSIAIVVG